MSHEHADRIWSACENVLSEGNIGVAITAHLGQGVTDISDDYVIVY